MLAPNSSETLRDSITLKELLQQLWRRRLLVGAITLALCAAGALFGWLVPKSYKASVVVSPVSNTPGSNLSGGGLSSLASQFGGLAALAGISLSGDSRKAESLAVLQSDDLTMRYIRENNLLPIIFSRKWDAARQRWRVLDPKDTPTLWKGNQAFRKRIRTVVTDTKTGLVTFSIEWQDPKLAAKWANDLVALTNDYLRAKAIAESERNIAYLNQEAAKSDVVGVKQAIYSILQTEINKEMLARGSEAYALRILDPATVPEEPSSAKPIVWVMAALLVSLLASLVVAFVRAAWLRG
jgi:uncharacterized protein involved in exopolysaccharide biosynthesis